MGGVIFMESFGHLRWVDSSPDSANPFFTGARSSGESNCPGGSRIQQGIGDGLAISGIPWGKPMIATTGGWGGFCGGSSGVRFAFGRR